MKIHYQRQKKGQTHIYWFQLLKCEDLLLFIFVLDYWLDKTITAQWAFLFPAVGNTLTYHNINIHSKCKVIGIFEPRALQEALHLYLKREIGRYELHRRQPFPFKIREMVASHIVRGNLKKVILWRQIEGEEQVLLRMSLKKTKLSWIAIGPWRFATLHLPDRLCDLFNGNIVL